MQGKSLSPIFEVKTPKWRDDFLYHCTAEFDLTRMTAEETAAFDKRWQPEGASLQSTPENQAGRNKEWKDIAYPGIHDVDELYHLVRDPSEMKNLASDPKYADAVKAVKSRLAHLLKDLNPRSKMLTTLSFPMPIVLGRRL